MGGLTFEEILSLGTKKTGVKEVLGLIPDRVLPTSYLQMT